MRTAVPLVAVAHGSRDSRSAANVAALVEVVRALRPGLDVRLAFLDLSAPRLGDVLAAVAGEGCRRAVVVPLLLGSAYHARVDVPAVVAEARSRHPRLEVLVSDVLGPDPRLESAALRRLAAAGARPGDPDLGVVLAAAGSSHPPANAVVAEVARRWADGAGWAGAEPAFAAAAAPDVATAVERLRARGARRIALGSWFLAPGLLPDRVREQVLAADPRAVVADPLGPDPEVAELVVQRYATAEPSMTARYA
ncbi:Sirohydrochlorin ferrochelatase [Streptoalloteichus tenebrarius]|uniref:Sirohydrochlorin ferrochelatase n=1 Tax=Streptoalloteichus tenebrarius (strain ATCC 17920 / DSM 40477 / JCM 4838 / CBS 697.72 / NBRC 16177 / NCIMB 11028 / NRRL B-12390 / A12253. 1 / ISP 5477) TaxID=1933 RepID=A0ABT1HZA5_STRSD|nr:sirohydrochlorin chelatase [Streptoalloteichus tenebrarius]MCP2260843.1 Sirohydrochlorin ferrochelatase [Streptoalloteichus tenebrarius]